MKQEDLLKLVRKEFKDEPFIAKNSDQNFGFKQVRNYIDHTRNAFEFGNLNSQEFRERYKADYVLETWKNYYSPSYHRMKEIQSKELNLAIDKDMENANSGRPDSHAESFQDKVKAKHSFETAYFNYRDKEVLGQQPNKDEIQKLEDTYLDYRKSQGLSFKKEKVQAEIKANNWIEESKKKIELKKSIEEGTLQRKVDVIANRNSDPTFKPNRETPELAALAEESGMFMRKDFIQNKVADMAHAQSLKEFPEYTSNIKKSVEETAKTDPKIVDKVSVAKENLAKVVVQVKEQEQSSWDDNITWAKNYKPSEQVKPEHITTLPLPKSEVQAFEVPKINEVKSNIIDLRSRSKIEPANTDWDDMEQWAKNRPRIENKTPMLSLVDNKPVSDSSEIKTAPKPLYEIPGTIQKWEDQTPEFKKVIFDQEERMRARGENVKSVIPKEHLDIMLKEKEALTQNNTQENALKLSKPFTMNVSEVKQNMEGIRMKMRMS